MNRKILTIFAVFLIAVSMASVCAVELNESQDFDGLFKMNVVSDDNFTQVNNPILEADEFYKNSNDTIFVLVYDKDIGAAVTVMSKGNLSIINSAISDENGVVNEDNLFMFNSTDEMANDIGDYNFTSFVGIDKSKGDNRAVIVCGNDTDLLKEYANTITFDK